MAGIPKAQLTAFGSPGMLVSMVGYHALRRFVDQYKTGLIWLGAASFTLFFFATNLYISNKRLLWSDEFNAIRTAKLPDLATLWRIQNSWRGDSAPILYSLLARWIYALSGGAELSIRILSALAMAAAMVVVFDCARRLRDGACGLIAMGALCASFLPYYGFEARPYMLVVLFTAIALWLWLHTKVGSTAAAIAFGMSIFLAITVHFYGVLALAPFALWDLWHRPRWRPSLKLLAGIAGMVGAISLCAQQVQSGAHWAAQSWCPPSLRALVWAYTEIFPYGMFLLAAFVFLACFTRVPASPMGESERCCWLFVTIPIVGFVVAKVWTNHFHNRYLITILPGVSVAFACFVSRYLAPSASMLLVLLAIGISGGHQVRYARHPESIEPPAAGGEQSYTRAALTAESAILADGKTKIMAGFLLADEARYYSKHPEVYISYKPDDILEYYCREPSPTCWTPDTIKSNVQHLAVLYPSIRFLQEMSRAGIQATIKMPNPMVVYLSTR